MPTNNTATNNTVAAEPSGAANKSEQPPPGSRLPTLGHEITGRPVPESPDGWIERGASVDGTGTPELIPWARVGFCWAGTEHPVVAAHHD
jgi:hypothetical protein